MACARAAVTFRCLEATLVDLRAELAEVVLRRSQRNTQCRVCVFVNSQPLEDRAQWADFFIDNSIIAGDMLAVAQKHGFGGGRKSILGHRRMEHRGRIGIVLS